MVPRKNGLQSEEFYGTITHGKEIAGVMELADVTDSKSVGGDTVWVRVPPPAPNQYNPNLFPIGDGFGLFVFFDRYESTYFRNGVKRKPTSKPRGPRKKKKSI